MRVSPKTIPLFLIPVLVTILVGSCGIEDYPYLYSFEDLSNGSIEVSITSGNYVRLHMPSTSKESSYYSGFRIYYRLYPRVDSSYSYDTPNSKITTHMTAILNATTSVYSRLTSTYGYTELKFREIDSDGVVASSNSKPLAGDFDGSEEFYLYLTSPSGDSDFIPYAELVTDSATTDYALVRDVDSDEYVDYPYMKLQYLPDDCFDTDSDTVVSDIQQVSGASTTNVDIVLFIVAYGLDQVDSVYSTATALSSSSDYDGTTQYLLMAD